MKKFLVLVMILSLMNIFAGCRALYQAERYIDHRLDAAENQAEQAIRDTISPTDLPTAAPAPTENLTPAGITETQAQAIALEHAGFTQQEVSRLQVRTDWDDGRQEYDVEFHAGHLEYEYEIDLLTGKILSFDKDH